MQLTTYPSVSQQGDLVSTVADFNLQKSGGWAVRFQTDLTARLLHCPVQQTDVLVKQYCATNPDIIYQCDTAGGHVAQLIDG